MAKKSSKSWEATASIWAAIIGGIFAILAAFLPGWLERAKQTPTSSPVVESPVAVTTDTPAKSLPNLTLGTWTIRAAGDEAGNDFTNSLLKITSQQPSPDGLQVTGVFVWREHDVDQGEEHVTGTYVAATRQLFLEGKAINGLANNQLTPGAFSARLSDDGRQLLDGTWGSTTTALANVPGSWEARR